VTLDKAVQGTTVPTADGTPTRVPRTGGARGLGPEPSQEQRSPHVDVGNRQHRYGWHQRHRSGSTRASSTKNLGLIGAATVKGTDAFPIGFMARLWPPATTPVGGNRGQSCRIANADSNPPHLQCGSTAQTTILPRWQSLLAVRRGRRRGCAPLTVEITLDVQEGCWGPMPTRLCDSPALLVRVPASRGGGFCMPPLAPMASGWRLRVAPRVISTSWHTRAGRTTHRQMQTCCFSLSSVDARGAALPRREVIARRLILQQSCPPG